MASKVPNLSDLICRVASSCLSQRLPSGNGSAFDGDDDDDFDDYSDLDEAGGREESFGSAAEADNEDGLRIWEEEKEKEKEKGAKEAAAEGSERAREMEALMAEVFDTISAVKRAYASLQEAHSPWDPDRMRAADAAVVAELRKLGSLRDRFRRGSGGGVKRSAGPAASLRDAVAPYEAALDDLKKEMKAKETEVESLKERLRSAAAFGGAGRRGRLHTSKRLGCAAGVGGLGSPTPELFEACVERVKAATKGFAAHLLALMRAARWDAASAVRSIAEGSPGEGSGHPIPEVTAAAAQHARHALEACVNRRLFHGFEHETFYLDGSLTSLLRPAEFRRGCFAQFRDMRSMDPAELLGVLPTCQFGQFAAKKYLAVVPAGLEESLFGGAEQRRHVAAGGHPRTGFYGEFLRAAKAVWLLHLLAFALDPAPSHFEARTGAEFQAEYMESVVRFAGGQVVLQGALVGFAVAPGFKLGDGAVVKARVYVVPRPGPGGQ